MLRSWNGWEEAAVTPVLQLWEEVSVSLAQHLCKGVGTQVRVRQLQGIKKNMSASSQISWEDLGTQAGVTPDLSMYNSGPPVSSCSCLQELRAETSPPRLCLSWPQERSNSPFSVMQMNG